MLLTTFCQKKGRVRALTICTLPFVLLFFLSCTAAHQNNQQSGSSLLQAENSMMKKRLPLIERESDVLKKENQQYRIKIQDLEMQNKQLSADLASLREQYESDIAAGNQQISSLEEENQKNTQESKANIDRLTADNKALQEKMTRDLRALKDQIVMQKAAYNKDREKLVQENAQKQLDLTNKLEAADTELAMKKKEISSLQTSIGEVFAKLVKANTLSTESAKARTAAMAELESIKAAGIKAKNEYQVQLESIRAANADLNKQIAELSRDRSRQKQPEPVPVTQP